MQLTKYERETIINYNQQEHTVTCYTCDHALIRKLDKLSKVSSEIHEEKQDEFRKTYSFPKRWLKIKMPRQLTEEERQKRADRASIQFGFTAKKQ